MVPIAARDPQGEELARRWSSVLHLQRPPTELVEQAVPQTSQLHDKARGVASPLGVLRCAAVIEPPRWRRTDGAAACVWPFVGCVVWCRVGSAALVRGVCALSEGWLTLSRAVQPVVKRRDGPRCKGGGCACFWTACQGFLESTSWRRTVSITEQGAESARLYRRKFGDQLVGATIWGVRCAAQTRRLPTGAVTCRGRRSAGWRRTDSVAACARIRSPREGRRADRSPLTVTIGLGMRPAWWS